MQRLSLRLILPILLLVAAAANSHADKVDHSQYASLLNQFVADGVVDYKGIQHEEAVLDRYLDMLASVKPAALSRDERFAFYVNAYNAWTIKLILSRYPDIDSIKDLGSLFSSPWKKKIARIDGQLLTLDQIEHDILRKQFKDPRVHFAVNCASKSCPPLLTEPYTGDRLQAQLDKVTKVFINDNRFNRLEGNSLWVSKIFDWFAEDFNDDIVGFFIKYADGSLHDQLIQNRSAIMVKYVDYDWSLNGT